MDGHTNSRIISNLFSNKYKNILDNPLRQVKGNIQNIKSELSSLKIESHHPREKIYNFNIENAVHKLNACIGHDGIHSNHIKLGGNELLNFLSKLFSSFILHNYIPKKC